jgi:hypothetical protein
VAERSRYADLHVWLAVLGLNAWSLPASLLVLVALGLWTHRHRQGDLWLLLGVAALVARLWTYHRVYDDLLILIPLIALFRIAKQRLCADGGDLATGLLLGITVVAMLAPARLEHAPPPWNLLFAVRHATTWIAVLIFLLNRARIEKSAGPV